MKVLFVTLAAFAFGAFGAAVFSQTTVHPTEWGVTATAATFQSTGKTMAFYLAEMAQALKYGLLGLKGRIV